MRSRKTVFMCLAAIGCGGSALGADLPPNFVDEVLIDGLNQAVGLTFAPDGRMFIWEKAGRVYYVEPGLTTPNLLLDLSQEVGDWRDYGMLGFALDPDFYVNGRIYMAYVVDYHHLIHFGTPQYDPLADEYLRDTIGRVTRYTCDSSDGFRSVLPNTRQILLGESISTGIPIMHQSHGVGTLLFGRDGTLILSCGDGASYNLPDLGGPQEGSSGTALADGIIRPAEDVGALRAQMVNSHSGKIMRLDPNTGDGVSSNPFFDAAEPRSPKSRVWALGLRNPYRITIRPNTGSTNPADANPGTLLIGDVGWATWEEIDVCRSGGLNFGWPLMEGYATSQYTGTFIPNQDAPNPLAGGGCADYFTFEDLLIEDTASPSFPNPCNAAEQVPASIPHFVHARPMLDYFHDYENGPSRTKTFTAGVADTIRLDDAASPLPGPNFGGNASISGMWYSGTQFPAEYQNAYFHADFSTGWIRSISFDANDNPTIVRNFASDLGLILALAQNPADDGLYFIKFDNIGVASVHRIRHVDNLPPVVVMTPTLAYGPAPFSVQFSSAGTHDPEAGPLAYAWNFGDGSPPSAEPSPLHVYSDYPWVDVSMLGTIVARVDEMVPPGAQGQGTDPEVIRDGDYPPTGSLSTTRQFDTFHFNEQAGVDWVGYEFGTDFEFRGLLFQEGRQFWDGGWLEQFTVQVRVNGDWVAVSDLSISPAYAGGNEISFERYSLTFTPIVGNGIRIYGEPAGYDGFFSIGELRAFAKGAAPITGPARYDATLTVTDDLRNSVTRTALISINNTPPTVTITNPANLQTYDAHNPTPTALTADVVDAEHSAAERSCLWRVRIHHDDHIHPEPPDTNCTTQALFDAEGHDGDVFFVSVRCEVTDAAGLSGFDEVRVYPQVCASGGCEGMDIAQPANCEIDIADLTTLLSNFGVTGLNIPGDSMPPFGEVDIADLTEMLSAFGRICHD